MAKSCSGTVTTSGLSLQPGSCNYDIQLFIDGNPITTIVSINSTMTDAQIAALLNANRTGNTTGTITVQTVGVITSITITGIVLSSTDSGIYTVVTNNFLPCASLVDGPPSTLLCSIIPPPKKKNGVYAPPAQVCINPSLNNPDCPPTYMEIRGIKATYELIGKDASGRCCYRIVRINK